MMIFREEIAFNLDSMKKTSLDEEFARLAEEGQRDRIFFKSIKIS